MKRKAWLTVAAVLLLPVTALAAETFDGTVVAGVTTDVTAPFGGTVQSASVREGAYLAVGDVAAVLDTTKVYAPEDGTVHLADVSEGDSVSGTVLTLSPVSRYTIHCDLTDAYQSPETLYVQLGEQVYLQCVKDGSHQATGVITEVDGSSYTVTATAGELYVQEAVYVYRSANDAASSRLGKGVVNRAATINISANGSLWKLHVADGENVERGQLLLETVEGELPGLESSGAGEVKAETSGIVTVVSAEAGRTVRQGETLLTLADPAAYEIAFSVSEELVSQLQAGDPVSIYFSWQGSQAEPVQGTLLRVSYVQEGAESSVSASTESEAPRDGTAQAQPSGGEAAAASNTTASENVTYLAYAAFTPDESVRLGMTVTVVWNGT